MTTRFPLPTEPREIESTGRPWAEYHVFDELSARAIDAALVLQRPLLVRGEPGLGKTQLARAAASVLGWPCLVHVLDARTEARDLLYHVDDVERLGQAQLLGRLPNMTEGEMKEMNSRLEIGKFVKPGPLWEAFGCSEEDKAKGFVLCLDEIDKASSEVHNGLLEALGERAFTPPGHSRVCAGDREVLVVCTTNETKTLPDALMRRFLVLNLELPRRKEAFVELLLPRARAHIKKNSSERVWRRAAEDLFEDRVAAEEQGVPLPGLAEYVDLIRLVAEIAPRDEDSQLAELERLRKFTYQKHRSDDDEPPYGEGGE